MTGDRRSGYDVFISYAHVDDLTLDGSPGFVTKLCNAISMMGRFKRGEEVRLFRDHDMASGTEWKPEIRRALESSLIFLPVVSASWQRSTYADVEWKTFKQTFPGYLGFETEKPVFPVLFEIEREGVGGELRDLQIRHRFKYTMTNDQWILAADSAVSELVKQLLRFKKPQ